MPADRCDVPAPASRHAVLCPAPCPAPPAPGYSRVATSCLLATLCMLFPAWHLAFVALIGLDIFSHWFQMYSTLACGVSSHKVGVRWCLVAKATGLVFPAGCGVVVGCAPACKHAHFAPLLHACADAVVRTPCACPHHPRTPAGQPGHEQPEQGGPVLLPAAALHGILLRVLRGTVPVPLHTGLAAVSRMGCGSLARGGPAAWLEHRCVRPCVGAPCPCEAVRPVLLFVHVCVAACFDPMPSSRRRHQCSPLTPDAGAGVFSRRARGIPAVAVVALAALPGVAVKQFVNVVQLRNAMATLVQLDTARRR